MNAPFVVAQATGAAARGAPVQTIKLYKPAAGETVVFHASHTGTVKIIFTDIANEPITLFKNNPKQQLHIIFRDDSQIIIEPFYDSTGSVLANFIIEVGPNQDFLTGAQFALQFPTTTDRNVLPAAGEGGDQASGAHFRDPSVDPLGPSNPLPLLLPEDLPPIQFTDTTGSDLPGEDLPGGDAPPPPPFVLAGAIAGLVEEEHNQQIIEETDGPVALGSNQGNEDPNDVTDAIDPLNPSGLDQDTPFNPNNTTNAFGPGSLGYKSLATLVVSSDGPPTFSFEGTTGTPVLDTAGIPVTSGGDPVKYLFINPTLVLGFADVGDDGSFSPGDRQVFVLFLEPSAGDYLFFLTDHIDHPLVSNDDGTNPVGAFEETLSLNLAPIVVITDGSGPHTLPDNAFSIAVIDDTPVADDETADAVDDEGATANTSFTGNPAGTDDLLGESNVSTGFLNVAGGADGLKDITFADLVGAAPFKAIYQDGGTGFALQETVSYEWDGATHTLTAKGVVTGDPVFTLVINDLTTGAYTFTINSALVHSDASESADLQIVLPFTAIDGDDDQVTGTFTVDVDDDTPLITVEIVEPDTENGLLALDPLDETTDPDVDGLKDGDDTYNAGETTDDDGDLDDVDGDPTAAVVFNQVPDITGGNPIGQVKTAVGVENEPGDLGSLFDVDADPGADGAKGPVLYDFDLVLSDVDPDVGGVQTTLKVTQSYPGGNGLPNPYFDPTVWLFVQPDGSIHGLFQTADGVFDGVAFKIYIENPDDPVLARLVVEQYAAIDHDLSQEETDPEDPSLFDETVSLLLVDTVESQSSPVLGVQLTVTLTDGDDDVVSQTSEVVMIANEEDSSIAIDDDGPRIDIDTVSQASLAFNLDESIGDPTANPPEDGSIDPDADLIGVLTAPNGVDPFGRASTQEGDVSGLFTDVLVDAGTDGQKDRDDSYSLTLTDAFGNPVDISSSDFDISEGVATTLQVTDANGTTYFNDTIYLFKVSDTLIEGRVDVDGDGDFDDANNVALRITLDVVTDPADPILHVDQILAIDHPTPATSHDEAVTLGVAGNDGPADATAGIGVTQTSTLTDGDDDTTTDSATVNITSGITIEDDGPVITIGAGDGSLSDLALNLDESIDSAGDGFNPVLAAGEDIYNGAELESNGGDPNGDLDDINGQTAPDGTNPIGTLTTPAGALAGLFAITTDAGTDGEKSVTGAFALVLSAAGLATTLSVTQPEPGGNPGVADYADPTIYLFQVSDTEIIGVVGSDVDIDGNPTGDIALRITLNDPTTAIGDETLTVEQILAIDHGEDGNEFDTELALNLVDGSLGIELTATLTDGDDDTATSETFGVTLIDDEDTFVSIDDDGPTTPAVGAGTAPLSALAVNLDESIDSLADGFNPDPLAGEDIYNGAETESGGGLPNGDLDDISGQNAVDGTDPIGSRTTTAGALSNLFNVGTLDAGTDGQESVSYPFALALSDPGLQTNLSVTQPVTGGNPDSDNAGAPNTPYANPRIYLFNEGGVIVGRVGTVDGGLNPVADPTGDIALRITLTDPDTSILGDETLTVEQILAIEHPSGRVTGFDTELPLFLPEGTLSATLAVTLTDGDTDFATDDHSVILIGAQTTFVSIDDDGPRLDVELNDGVTPLLQMDESINGPVSDPPETGSIDPDDDDISGVTTVDGTNPFGHVETDSGDVAGLFVADVVDAGTDGQKSLVTAYTLTLTNVAGGTVAIPVGTFEAAEGVATTLNVTDVNGTIAVQTIYLFQIDATTIEGRADLNGDNIFAANETALRITLDLTDPADPILEVDQILAIEHPDQATAGNSFDSYDESVTLGIANVNGAGGGIGITKTSTLTDGDDDTATDSATRNITSAIVIEDDGITVDIEAATFAEGEEPSLTLDESIGLDAGDANAEDDDNGAVVAPSYIIAANSALAIGTTSISDIGLTVGDLFTTPVVAQATDGLASQSTTSFSFTLKDADGEVVTDSTTPVATQLVATDTEGTVLDGLSATALTIWLFQLSATEIVGVVGRNADGTDNVLVADYVALRVQIVGSDLIVEQYLPIEHPTGGTSSFDEALAVLLADSDASLGVTASVTVTDGDGDTHTDTATFLLATSTASALSIEDDGPSTTLSENFGFFVNEDDLNNFVAGTGFGSAGTSPDPSPDDAAGDDPSDGSITNGTGGATPVNTITLSSFAEFGTDGPGGFALATIPNATPLATALTSKNNGVGPAETVLIVSTAALLTGYVELGGGSGFQAGTDRPVFTLELLNAATGELRFTLLDQVDHAPPPAGTSVENLLAAPFDLSSFVLVVDADGDTAPLSAGQLLLDILDDVPLSFSPADSTLDNVAGSVSADLDAVGKIGADEPLRIVFDGVTNGAQAQGSIGGDPATGLTSGGDPIFLYSFGLVLVGTTQVVATPGSVDDIGDLDPGSFVFKVTLDPDVGDDDYTFELIQPIDNGSGFVLETFSGVSGGNTDYFAIDQVGVQDVYFTPGGTGTSVNTNANEIGVGGGQSVGAGEALRIEFVTFDPAADLSNLTPGNFAAAIDATYDSTNFSFSPTAIQNGDTSQVKISAINADAATPPGGPPPAGTLATINEVVITFIDGTSHSFTSTSTFHAHTVTFNGDGTVNITGLESDNTADDLVQIFTSTGFDRLEILNTGTDNGNDGEDPFKIASIAIGNTITGDPVVMNFDVRITDNDGDSTAADFDVTVTPPAPPPPVMPLVGVFSVDSTGLVGTNQVNFQDGDLIQINQPHATEPEFANVTAFQSETSIFGEFDNNIDALHFLADGRILFSTESGHVELGGTDVTPDFNAGEMDLFIYDPTTGVISIPDASEFPATVFPGGSGSFADNEKIDALFMRTDGTVIISTEADATLPGAGTFQGNDLVHWDGTTATVVFDAATQLAGAKVFSGAFNPASPPASFLHTIGTGSNLPDEINAVHVLEFVTGTDIPSHFYFSPGGDLKNTSGTTLFNKTQLIEVFRADDGSYWINEQPYFDSGKPDPSAQDGIDIDAFALASATASVNIAATSLSDTITSSLVTIQFNGPVTNFAIGDLTAVGGALSGFTVVDGDTYTVTFTATDAFEGTGSVTLTGAYTEADADPGVTGAFDIVAIDRGNPTALGETIIVNDDPVAIPEWLLLRNDTAGAVDIANVSVGSGGTATHTAGGVGSGNVSFDDSGGAGGSFDYQAIDAVGNTSATVTATITRDTAGNVGGTVGADIFFGEANNDVFDGLGGNDLYAFRSTGDGSDVINDSSGTDSIIIGMRGGAMTNLGFVDLATGGGDGNLEILYNGHSITVTDHFDGTNENIETISFDGGRLGAYALGTGAYTLSTDDDSNRSAAAGVNTVLAGDSLLETLTGNTGNDLLFGNDGVDTMNGGAGNDLLVGGTGNDILDGGTGIDVLRYLGATGAANQDTINNYFGTGANRDIIDLSALLDAAFDPGDNINNFVKVTDTGADALLQIDPTGTGSFGAGGNIATLTGQGTIGNIVTVYLDGAEQQINVSA